MIKRVIFGTLAVLFSLFVLSGCQNTTTSSASTSVGSSAISGDVSLASDVVEENVSDSSDSQYNSGFVRLEVVTQTDLRIDNQFTQPFHNGYAIVLILDSDSGDYAFIDQTGKILGDRRFFEAFPFEDDGRALVQLVDKSWVYIDKTGKTVASGAKRSIRDFPFYQAGELRGLTDEKGNQLTKAIYTFADSFHNGLCFVQLADGVHKNAFIDKTGSIKCFLPDDWHNTQYAGDGMIFYKSGGNNKLKFQLYDMSGKLLNPTLFDMAGNFENGLAPVMTGNKLGLIDTKGNIVVKPDMVVAPFYLCGLSIGENLIVVATYDSKLMIIKIIR